MPFRLSIPLPGPVSWVPRRKRRAPILTPEQRETIMRRAGSAAGAIDRRNEAGWERHRERQAELAEIRTLPPVARFKAAMRFPLR
ncbi:hypothetical protein WHI96_25300 [Pseudonocardia tropica]|uniref:Uncharacterized protein n=1 Tax=Pseudonocardia tropica TaxID=681289 RepID=A0ABV1K1N3_9PSEU